MRDERLIVWSDEPLNAETPLDLLARSEVTPTELFFVRNHGAVPTVDAGEYRLTVEGDVREPMVLSLTELRDRFPRATVPATLACAGNRRRELDPVPSGIPWGAGAIGNALWAGVRLGDLLKAAGVDPQARHVAFTGLDEVQANGSVQSFGGSIPLEKALSPEVVIAYEMNGEPLAPEHGFPLRVVVPGYIGARSVKWLTAISVQPSPSANFFQTTDYALDGRALAELPLNSAVCRPRDDEAVSGTVAVEGYAIAGGGQAVERVEISADGGRSWLPVALGAGSEWTWRLWRGEVELPPGTDELAVRAWNELTDGQPEEAATTWNPRGYMNNAWHRVRLRRR